MRLLLWLLKLRCYALHRSAWFDGRGWVGTIRCEDCRLVCRCLEGPGGKQVWAWEWRRMERP